MSLSRPPSYTSRTGFSRLPDYDGLLRNEKAPQKPSRYSLLASARVSRWAWTFLHQYRKPFRAAPAALGSTLWLAMMGYFFVYYTTVLNKVDGDFPRIGPSYSVWPYISCIGAVRLRAFQGFAIAVATLVIISFGLDFWLGRHIIPGRWLRTIKLCLAIISDGFLIALSYESVNSASHLHLIFTSIQIWCMGTAKVIDDVLNHTMRKYDPKNKHLNISKRWKRAAGFVAFLTGPVAVVGIYGCQMPVGLLPDTTRCWKLVAWAAPCEWILSLCWSAYLYMIAYDLYHLEEVRESVIAKYSNNASTRLLSMRLAKSSPHSEDTGSFASPQLVSQPSRGYFGMITDYTAVKEQVMLNEEKDLG